jgi:cell division protein FtsW
MLTPQTSRASTSVGIAAVVAALLAVGLVMVASAGARLDGPIIEPRFWRTAFGRQLAFAVLGFLAMLITACGTHRWFAWRPGRRWQPVVMLFAVTVLCLVATFVPGLGVEKKGAQRWVTLGVAGLVFQPSELAKPVLVLLMAALLAGRRARLHEFRRGLLPAVIALALCAGLVGIEDFGTAGLLAGVGGALLVVAGARMLHLALVAIPGLAAMVYLIACEPYRVARLTTFLNIWDDPRGAGYHPVQSLITIASGGFAGRGLGAGVQKYGYLPEARSDFIFSVICEETGLIGAGLVIGLYAALLLLGWRVVRMQRDPYARLVAFGVTFLIVAQAVINIAVVTVCAPTKGISLPLVSAGGSGVFFLGLAAGLLVSVAREAEEASVLSVSAGVDGDSAAEVPAGAVTA